MRLLVTFIFLVSIPFALAHLKVGFYKNSCPKAESIVQEVVAKHFKADQNTTAGLLRLYAHDCLVKGCDASVLIEPTGNTQTERSDSANQSLRPIVFTIINEAKQKLEEECPSIVSCADIISLATRDSVALAGGPNYNAETGRRDGLVSNVDDVNIPGPNFLVEDAFTFFEPHNFTLEEMVVLVGGSHSVGVAHCSMFRNRLFNIMGTKRPDKTMHRTLRKKLIRVCGKDWLPLEQDPMAFLDQKTSYVIDNWYFHMIKLHRGVMLIDQQFAENNSTASFVNKFAADNEVFKKAYGDALVKFGRIDVNVGKTGNIRKKCTAFN